MAPSSPVVARWELMLRLRERRKELDISPAVIAKQLGISSGYWAHIEGERNLLSEGKLMRLLPMLEFDEAETQELLGLRLAAKERGWWSKYAGLMGTELMRLYGLEHGADSIRTFESVVVPGLLQCESYARALIASSMANVRAAEVDQRVAVRMRRQQRLANDYPLHLTVVIGQTALVQQTGGPEVLREQLHYLIALIDQHPDTIDLRVIPFDSPEGNVLGGATFHLLDFESTWLPTLAWHESAVLSTTSDDESHLRDLGFAYTQAQTVALSQDASLALIRQSANEVK